jgi:hypothetical protein
MQYPQKLKYSTIWYMDAQDAVSKTIKETKENLKGISDEFMSLSYAYNRLLRLPHTYPRNS